MPIPVTLEDGNCTWEKELTTRAICRHIFYLLTHDYKANEMHVFRTIEIDKKTRAATDNKLKNEKRKLHNYRIINKALAMELLSALLLTRLNSTTNVTSFCKTRNGLPHYYATSGKPDITADYPATGTTPEFKVLAEVSIKQDVTAESYNDQLWQARRHALKLAEETDQGIVYALVINAGKIGSDRALQGKYRYLLERDDLERNERVRLIPICVDDLVSAIENILEKLPGDRFFFGSDRLARICDTLRLRILANVPNNEAQWMCQTWVRIATDAPALDV